MAQNLSLGKYRGMESISNERGIITVAALDHRGSFKTMLKKAMPGQEIGYNEVVEEKLNMVRTFAPLSSAILLDPIYGAAAAVTSRALPGSVGLLVALEQSGYEGSDYARITPIAPGWSVEKIKRMGAAAVKLLLYYMPDAETATQQEDLVKRVAEECQKYDIAFLLEPMSYSLTPDVKKNSAEFAARKPDIVLESARRLAGLGIDLLKAEFPADPNYEKDESKLRQYARELTSISPVPWVILSAAETFDVFQPLVEIACEEGASGYMVGRAVWQEAMVLPNAEDRNRELETTGRSRMAILNAIADYRAKPWYAAYPAPSASEGWQKEYDSISPAVSRV